MNGNFIIIAFVLISFGWIEAGFGKGRPSDFSNASDIDLEETTHSREAAESFLRQYSVESVGDVRKRDDGIHELIVDGEVLFGARRIGKTRTKSETGLIVIDAIVGKDTPMDNADISKNFVNGRLVASLSEIWILERGKHPRIVSPIGVDARSPLISKDGTKVAFVMRELNAQGFALSYMLCVMNIETRELKTYSNKKYKEEFRIGPLEWLKDGKGLRVVTDYRETGDHLELKVIFP